MLLRRARGRRRASSATARRRRWRPTTACRVEDVRAALEDCRAVLADADGSSREPSCSRGCAEVAVLPQALAAVDLALWDLAGRRAPASRSGGCSAAAAVAQPVEVNAHDRRSRPAGAAAAAAAARAAGFAMRQGEGRRSATTPGAWRPCARRPARRWRSALDANGAWSVDGGAARHCGCSSRSGSSCARSRCAAGGDRARWRRSTRFRSRWTRPPRLPGALDRRACDAVCLKISRCGGITGLLEAAAAGAGRRLRGLPGLDLDGPLGIAAALHAAAALCAPTEPAGWRRWRCSTARRTRCAGLGGAIAVPAGPGSATACSTGTASADDSSTAATRSGASRCTACPAPGTTSTLGAGDRARPSAPAIARNLSSRSPTISVTGMVSSPSRSHSDGSAPVPSPRSAARQAGGGVAQPVRAATARRDRRRLAGQHRGLRPAPRERLDRPASSSSASASSARAGALALARVGEPGAGADQHQALHPLAAGRARRAARSAPHRVAGQREVARRRAREIVEHRRRASTGVRRRRPSRGRAGRARPRR